MSYASKTFRRRVFASVAALALVVTACGGDDVTDDTPQVGGDEGTEDTTTDETTDGTDDGADDGATGETTAGGDLLAELQEAGVVRVGIADEEPYGYVDDDGNVTGQAPEVARRVLEELGIEEIDAQVVAFESLIAGLQAGQFDMITAGMYINPDRAQQILFSDPDYCVGEAFAVPEGNPQDISDLQSVADNPDVTLAILSGAVEEGYADTAGVPDDQIEFFSDVNAQYEALQAGRVDAVIGTTLTVLTQVEDMDGFEATESFFPLDEDGEEILGCGGYGFRNDDQEFRDAFNDELNRLQDEGELLPIITDFGFAEEDIERAQELTVEDLAG
ncbi:ectoine/hydroxyectoine ABC transporter substrate-binding protein EhuB [Egicoccus halophilus]|uniref:Ectoine/hydroxyectoine ABC transporter substrate-binding protein EhuB n=1 Tax=Egicoccus halophilus TaxID=1670830 RepID=A0A8J3A5I9_9ACTN|nr:ectoine/hydroxyectoine ABC transporter substrate-binding protein EhuB [Egicoccus halophilus]GGI03604.1 ectoine/hydroxyectoine ABC transporter substrate-binding protein EhuB [Egicoccus halophilus]